MTLEEKKSKVIKYCSGRLCSDCALTVGGWTMPVGNSHATACPAIDLSPERDLDRALAIIDGEECTCPTCRYYDSQYDNTECVGCLYRMLSTDSGYDTAPVKWTPLVDMDVVEEDPVNDPVNHPEHYTSGGIECLDAIKASMTPIEYAGFLKGQVLKYT